MQQDQPPDQPIYWDNDRTSLNLTLILAMGIAIYGLVIQAFAMGLAGLAIAAYTWLTRPRRYLIYPNHLLIQYGMPRVKVISFEQISHLELLSLAIGDRLRVVLLNGRRTMIMVRDLDTFRDKLDAALETFQGKDPSARGEAPEGGYPVLDQPPQPQEPDSPTDTTYAQPGDTVYDDDSRPDFEGRRNQ